MTTKQQPKPGWTWVKFGDVVRLNTARCADPAAEGIERYVGLEHIEPEDLHIRRWGLVAEGTTFTNRFQPGQVLFGKRRAYQRKVAVADFAGVCSGDIYVFEPKDERLRPELLPFLCQTERFFEYAVGTSAGSLSPRTNWTQLANYEFALPPLEEQRRIGNLLSVQDSLSIEMGNIKESLQRMKHSKLLSEFGSYISPKEDWQRLSAYCEYIGDGTHFPPPFTESGVPFLLVSNIASGELDKDITRWITPEAYQQLIKSFRPSCGDILFSLVGSYGVPVYIDWDWDFSFQRHIGVMRTDQERLRGKYLFYFLQSLPARRQANQCAEGLAQKTITLKSLRSYRLPIPDISEQDRIIEEIQSIDDSLSNIKKRISSLVELRKATLSTVLEGNKVL